MNMAQGIEDDTHHETFLLASIERSQHLDASRTTSASTALRDTYAVLRTAIPFTEDDRVLAEANISYAKFEGALMDKEIVRVQQILEELQSRRDKLRRFEELEKGLLSPIRKLPFEILQHIFLLAHGELECLPPHDFRTLPRIVSQVCSYWRSVAHSCASLWRVLNYTIFHEKTDKYDPRHGKFLTDCLQLSNELPLSLQFSGSVTPEILGDSCVQGLGLSAHRWEYLYVGNSYLTSALFASIPKGSTFENLDSLYLKDLLDKTTIVSAAKLTELFLTGSWNVMDPNTVVNIVSAPSLVHLNIENIYRPSISLYGIDWSLIRQFEATELDFEPGELITILKRMPNILSLTLDGPAETSESITLPSLETLILFYPEGGHIFDILTAPCLKKVYVEYDFDFSSISASFVGFARRSHFRLEELTVGTIRLDDSWLTPELNNVKTLCLNSYRTSWRNIKRLKLQTSSSPYDIFPELNSLHLTLDCPTEYPENECDITALVDMLKSRLIPQQNGIGGRIFLKSVSIHFVSSLDKNDTSILTDFVKSELLMGSEVQVKIDDRGSLLLET